MISSAKSVRLAALAVVGSLVLACGGATTSPSPSGPAATTGSQPSAPAASEPAGSEPPAGESPAAESPAAGGELPTGDQIESPDIQMGFSVTEVSQYAGVLASQLGIYERNGLNVEYSVFEGDARVADALQSGQIQIGFSGTSSAISSQLTDVPYDVIAVLAVILTDDLVCQSQIQNAEHMKADPADGEPATIAISTFGGTSNAAALLALQALELAPTDAVITQVGGQSARLAALEGGSIDCAIVDSNMREDMLSKGFSIVTQLKEAGIPFGRSGMSVTEEWLAANPNTALVALASVLEAQNEIFTNTEAVVEHYVAFTENDEETALALLQDFTEIGNLDLMWTEDAFKNPQKAIAMINPNIIDVEVQEAANDTLLQQLVDIGLYEELGIAIEP